MIDGWRRDPKEPAVEEGIDIKIGINSGSTDHWLETAAGGLYA